ncbi:hypothetical protein JX266_012526 [Neoarthrinium moseri]|nr:hypothetical protein JX266_012526 [Neoarthrinium moseri]
MTATYSSLNGPMGFSQGNIDATGIELITDTIASTQHVLRVLENMKKHGDYQTAPWNATSTEACLEYVQVFSNAIKGQVSVLEGVARSVAIDIKHAKDDNPIDADDVRASAWGSGSEPVATAQHHGSDSEPPSDVFQPSTNGSEGGGWLLCGHECTTPTEDEFEESQCQESCSGDHSFDRSGSIAGPKYEWGCDNYHANGGHAATAQCHVDDRTRDNGGKSYWDSPAYLAGSQASIANHKNQRISGRDGGGWGQRGDDAEGSWAGATGYKDVHASNNSHGGGWGEKRNSVSQHHCTCSGW